MNELKAKSDGKSLVEHSKEVARFATRIAELSGVKSPELMGSIKLSALLHDIGKACTKFQHMLSEHNAELKTGNKFRHNEIGWAFLVNALPSGRGDYNKKLVLNTVYWHHGISNRMSDYQVDDVMNTLDTTDTENMFSVYDEFGFNRYNGEPNNPNAPAYYQNDDDNDVKDYYSTPDAMIVRTCVLSADRIVSSLRDSTILQGVELDEMLLDNINKRNTTPEYYDNVYNNERFNLQKQIASTTDKTVVVKAPAGFGKTMVGLLWSFKSNKKLLWVCPRNVVAESVYKSLNEEMVRFKCGYSIELFLSGEVKESTHATAGYESDIIVTNIDNFLSPSFDTRKVDKFYQTINCDVVFDEYHELVSEAGLFACFINLMKARHTKVDVRTLLLSATPSLIHNAWDTNACKTTILPNEVSHYPAAHNALYKIITTENDTIESVQAQPDTLVMFNSIKNTQDTSKRMGDVITLHSHFEKAGKAKIMESVYNSYGKKQTCLEKPCVVAAPVVQASVDVSFTKLRESVISPESTLQRIGRCNRWGDKEGEVTVHVSKFKDKREQTCITQFYDNGLHGAWFNTLHKFNGKSVTLNELYVTYNEFNAVNKVDIMKYINKLRKESVKALSKIYPIKFDEKVKSKCGDVMRAGSNKLRSSGSEVFYIVKKTDGTYTEPFTCSVFGVDGFKGTFHECGDRVYQTIVNAMKHITKQGDNRYDYENILDMCKRNKFGVDDIRVQAKNSNTPYIAINLVYDEKLGIVEL